MNQSPTTAIARELNREFKGRGFKCSVAFIGSFVGLRINDEDGRVSVKDACDVRNRANSLLNLHGLIRNGTQIWGPNYQMGGIAITWERL